VQPVHSHLRNQICSEQDAIWKSEEKLSRRVGLAAQFGTSCANIDKKVRICVEQPADISQILRMFRYMSAHECGFRVPREYAVALCQQFFFSKMRTVITPFRVCSQLFVTLVRVVDR